MGYWLLMVGVLHDLILTSKFLIFILQRYEKKRRFQNYFAKKTRKKARYRFVHLIFLKTLQPCNLAICASMVYYEC